GPPRTSLHRGCSTDLLEAPADRGADAQVSLAPRLLKTSRRDARTLVTHGDQDRIALVLHQDPRGSIQPHVQTHVVQTGSDRAQHGVHDLGRKFDGATGGGDGDPRGPDGALQGAGQVTYERGRLLLVAGA